MMMITILNQKLTNIFLQLTTQVATVMVIHHPIIPNSSRMMTLPSQPNIGDPQGTHTHVIFTNTLHQCAVQPNAQPHKLQTPFKNRQSTCQFPNYLHHLTCWTAANSSTHGSGTSKFASARLTKHQPYSGSGLMASMISLLTQTKLYITSSFRPLVQMHPPKSTALPKTTVYKLSA